MTETEIEALAAQRTDELQASIVAEENARTSPTVRWGDRAAGKAGDRPVSITAGGWAAVWRVLRFLLVAHFRRELEAEQRRAA